MRDEGEAEEREIMERYRGSGPVEPGASHHGVHCGI